MVLSGHTNSCTNIHTADVTAKKCINDRPTDNMIYRVDVKNFIKK